MYVCVRVHCRVAQVTEERLERLVVKEIAVLKVHLVAKETKVTLERRVVKVNKEALELVEQLVGVTINSNVCVLVRIIKVICFDHNKKKNALQFSLV